MILLPGKNNGKLIKRNANQFDTIRTMKDVAYQSAKNPYFKYLIKKHNLKDDIPSIKKVFDYAFFNTRFKKDLPKVQQIRSGIRSLRDKTANCVDYCILLSSFLLNLGVGHSFRMVSTRPNENFSHIYLVLEDGTPLDCVIGQNQDGKEQYKSNNERKNFFGMEIPYYNKYDLKIL
jgi:hypothetical protein